MQKITNKKWLPVLMALTILAIAAFQIYWLRKAYEREERTLDMRTNYLFRETVYSLQTGKLKLENPDTARRVYISRGYGDPMQDPESRERMARMIDMVSKKARDSGTTRIMMQGDSVQYRNLVHTGRKGRLMQFLFDMDLEQDSLTIPEIETAFASRLEEQGIRIPFRVIRTETPGERQLHQVTLGFSKPVTYRLQLLNETGYLLRRILVPVLFSVFLVGFTILSFSLLYRNLLRQRRLAEIKNEFISNITHELKTPIATVSVAIEALRNFNSSIDASRTREYLDISANELQRLSLLVDKVLKLSMFEKKEVELKYESLDLQELVREVTSSMRLQFENRMADVRITSEGDTVFEGDRLHLVSVIFNLLDNAPKYSGDEPRIHIHVAGGDDRVSLQIRDSGIGIPREYHGRIFEKFFRVPTGNLHNAKGYGLGLSYVSHVVNKHQGRIRVQSEEGGGSEFHISLPRQKEEAA